MNDVGRMKVCQRFQGIQANNSNLLLSKRSSAQFDEISDRAYRTIFHQYLKVIMEYISTKERRRDKNKLGTQTTEDSSSVTVP